MLSTNNLFCGYANKNVLEEVSLKISEREIFSLIGLNGSGKTTLLKTLLGLLPPLRGEIKNTSSITMLEANPSAPFAITLEELFKIRKNHVEEVFLKRCVEIFNVGDFYKKNILELSSGQAKRVWLAHLFSLRSKLILIDEPFNHLDWIQQKNLCDIIKQWCKEFHTTFVLAAHELELVANLSDQIALVGRNKILTQGRAEDVLTSKEVSDLFAFKTVIDENPIDGSKRITLGKLNGQY